MLISERLRTTGFLTRTSLFDVNDIGSACSCLHFSHEPHAALKNSSWTCSSSRRRIKVRSRVNSLQWRRTRSFLPVRRHCSRLLRSVNYPRDGQSENHVLHDRICIVRGVDHQWQLFERSPSLVLVMNDSFAQPKVRQPSRPRT